MPPPFAEHDGPASRVLVVDDDPSARGYFERALSLEGYEVVVADSGQAALAALKRAPMDLIVSDIKMPGLSGIGLLKAIRNQDLDVPVILVTGNPNVDSAVSAVQYGALRYLMKPVALDELKETVRGAIRLSEVARAKRAVLERLGQTGFIDVAALEASFERALVGIRMVFQPIVSYRRQGTFAFEALLRSQEKSLCQPDLLLEAAERLGRLRDLGRLIRQNVAATISNLCDASDDTRFFVNLHPSDLTDDLLYTAEEPLAKHAERVVFEVTERASLDSVDNIKERTATLKKLGFHIALDDLGAGYSGLTSFVHLEPDVVKIDMSLVQGVTSDPTKKRLVQSVIGLCNDLDMSLVAEGVEEEEDFRTLVELGVDLLQGYAFGRPQNELVYVPKDRFG